jgi:uncharacterized protein YggE
MKRLLTCLVLAFIVVASPARAADPTTIAVSGMGSISMMPDEATVNASVVTNASTANAAVSENNARYEKIVASAVNAGAKRDDVSLSYYNVDYVAKPNPAPPPQPYDRYGYTVTRSFSIKVHAIDKAGSMVDALTNAGASNIGGVSFGLSKPENARHAATDKAMTDAHAKAVELARAAGLRITGIKSIDLDGGGGIVRPMVMMKMNAGPEASPPTTLDPGSVNVSVNVTVVFLAAP